MTASSLRVHGRRVAVAAEAQLRDGGRDALVGAVDLDELEDGAEDLAREREVVADAAGPHDEQLRALGDREPGQVRERGRRLRHGLDVRGAAAALREEQLRDAVLLVVVEEQRALALHRRLQLRRDRAVDDRGLLGGAGRAPVEDLGGHDAARRVVDVAHRGVDVGGHVARADGVGRLARGVGREHHRARARGEHEVGAVMAHERVGARHRDARHRLDQVGRARPPPARPPASRARSRRSSARRADAAPARSRCASWPRSAT